MYLKVQSFLSTLMTSIGKADGRQLLQFNYFFSGSGRCRLYSKYFFFTLLYSEYKRDYEKSACVEGILRPCWAEEDGELKAVPTRAGC